MLSRQLGYTIVQVCPILQNTIGLSSGAKRVTLWQYSPMAFLSHASRKQVTRVTAADLELAVLSAASGMTRCLRRCFARSDLHS
jgi:hypothetical protein